MENKKEYNEEKELNLYDIIDILKKYKNIIIKWCLIGFLLSFVIALGVRNFNKKEIARKTFTLNYEQFQNKLNYYEVMGFSYNKFDPVLILKDEKYIDKFLEIKELKDMFNKVNTTVENRVDKKINFISKIITITTDKTKEKEVYTLIVEADKNLNLVEKVVNKYFEILDSETSGNLKILIEKEKESSIVSNKEASKQLEEIKEKTAKIIAEDSKLSGVSSDSLEYIVKLREPLLISTKEFQQSIYDRTSKEINGANQILSSNILDEIIEDKTSLIIEDKAGIAKYVLLGGVILTLLLIAAYIVLKELTLDYEEYEKSKK